MPLKKISQNNSSSGKAKKTNQEKNPTADSKKFNHEEAEKRSYFLILLALLGILLSALSAVNFYFFSFKYGDRILPGVTILGLNLSGATRAEAEKRLMDKIEDHFQNGIKYSQGGQTGFISDSIISLESDLNKTLFYYDYQAMAESALRKGRSGSDFFDYLLFSANYFNQQSLPLIFSYDEALIEGAIKDIFSAVERPSQNTRVKIFQNNEYELSAGTAGNTFDYRRATEDTIRIISELTAPQVAVKKISLEPEVSQELAEQNSHLISLTLSAFPLELIYQDKKWWFSSEDAYFLEFFLDSGVSVALGIERATLQKKLASLAEEIDVEPRNARFEFSDEKIKEFELAKSGLRLDNNASAKAINDKLREFSRGGEKKPIELSVNEIEPLVKNEEVNDLGIKEIIGIGDSNFSGSPKNRIHNIYTGAARFNGWLIKPEEEFNLNTSLGEVNAATGYLPEMVIKGDRTIPEYGGGLCQIATTVFRAAVESGLPITRRTNHSYLVSYYKPWGYDAAIYDEWTNVKFINDTGNHILIQTRIEGAELYFEFWGTKDGRTVDKNPWPPATFNWTNPGPTKEIETDQLAPGERDCIERPHTGVNTEFTYTVTYAGGEQKKQVFSSHYVAWPEVCLVGIDPEEKKEDAPHWENGDENKEDAGTPEEVAENNGQNAKEADIQFIENGDQAENIEGN